MIQNLAISYPDFTLNTIIDPDQFDTNNTEIVNKLNELLNKLHSIDGAREIIADGIEGISGSVDLQTMLVAIKQYIDTGDSDTDLYNKYNELVTALDNNKTYNEATFRKKIDSYSKIEVDNKLALKADKTTTYTKTQTDALVAGVTLGQIPNNSLAEIKMANDMKKDIVGGVASYNEYKTFKDSTSNSLTDMANKLNNLNTNDVQARQEIIDIKLKLKEQQSIDFINKTGIGYYDLFKDKTGIDEANTTATIDTSNHKIVFPTVDKYTVKSVGAFTDVAEIKVDKEVNVKDRVNNIEVLNKTAIEEVGTHEIIDATVINQAYDTSGNGGRKLVRLSNGWLVSAVKNGTSNVQIYKSIDNGLTWSVLTTITSQGMVDISIVSKGTNVYLIKTYYPSPTYRIVSYKIDCISGTSTMVGVFEDNQTAIGNCSLAINNKDTELHACWSSKNATYPNSFNIRYAKGTINVDGSVTWGSVEQVTTLNTSGHNVQNPSIVFINDKPKIIMEFVSGGIYMISCNGTGVDKDVNYNGRGTIVYSGGAYSQSSPSAIFVPKEINGLANGRIWVAWHGKDSVQTTINNTRVSYSDDNGVTWSTMQKLTTNGGVNPSISANKNNKIFIVYDGFLNGSYDDICMVANDNETWGSEQLLNASSTNHKRNSSTLYDISLDFSVPLFIYTDMENSKVGFYGTWQDTLTNYNLSLASTITTTDKQELTVQPYKFKNLKMLPQTFDNFDNINLALYPTKINKATIKEDVNNSTTVITGVTDKEITVGDKLFMNGVLNEVLTSTGNFTNYNVQDATVANSAYDTSGNGGRKLVRLNNGTLVSVSKNVSNNGWYLKKSSDNGLTWYDLGNFLANIQDVSIATDGIYIYVITCYNNSLVYFRKYSETALITDSITIDTSQTTLGNCSLAINNTGTELHACWTSKNSSYSSSFNIRYAKCTINGDGSVTWSTAVQMTTLNVSAQSNENPCIIYENNIPHIFYSFKDTSSNIYRISHYYWNGTNFTGTANVYSISGGAYIQYNPSAIFVPKSINGLVNGRILVAWHGIDNISTPYKNIMISYSDDGGLTWSTMEKLTNGTTAIGQREFPSITVNKNNDIFIVYQGNNTKYSSNYLNLFYITNKNGIWGTETDITSKTTGSAVYSSTLYDTSLDFSIPLTIYKDSQDSRIGFYGTWTIGEGYTLTMQNPTTLSANVQVPIVDLEAKQATIDMVLKDIDEEKFIYECDNLNTTTSDIAIFGSATELDTMSYAIS